MPETNSLGPLRESDIRAKVETQIAFYKMLQEKSCTLSDFMAAADKAGFEVAFVPK